MTWLQRYRVRHYVRNSIWIVPVLALVLGIITFRLLYWLETSIDQDARLDADTMRAVLGILAGAIFTFIVFVFSSLLLVVQLASAQLTPRVIGTMFRDPVTKYSLAVFVFNFTFSLSALIRIGSTAPPLVSKISAYGFAASLAVFLYLIDHVGKMLRPSGAFKSVASEAHAVIENVYPRRMMDAQEKIDERDPFAEPKHIRRVTSLKAGVVLAFDLHGLVALGTRHDCVIELRPQVGNFVAPGDPLFRVHGGPSLTDQSLRHSIALGAERTMEQDPTFAIRLIVDIASKALSPAINDPTTAVLAIDRIHHLLRHVGGRRLDNEKVRDKMGRVRLIVRTPDWEDFVTLATTEIRQFGGASIQVARRLRAMLEDLIETLPEERANPLLQELKILKSTSERSFQEPEDRVR